MNFSQVRIMRKWSNRYWGNVKRVSVLSDDNCFFFFLSHKSSASRGAKTLAFVLVRFPGIRRIDVFTSEQVESQ